MKIDKLINIEGYSLAIFGLGNKSGYWQYSILLPHGRIISPSEIYKSPQAAERVGRAALNKVLGR